MILTKLNTDNCKALNWVRLTDANTGDPTNVYAALDCNGKVVFKGFANRDDTLSGVLWFVLPSNLRPTTEVNISSSWFHAAKGDDVYSCIVVVSTNGNVNIYYSDPDGWDPPSPVVCFENLSFYK